MKVEVIEKYTGLEDRKILTIWGDNGALCRPYIAAFEIGKYYLIAPSKITETTETGTKNDYDFFTCSTDYLSVDFNTKIAYGEYSKKENQVTLQDFEKEIKGINFKNTKWFTSNNEKKFYKADTVTLLRLLNLKNKVVKLNEALIKSEQNKNLNYTELHFKPNSKLIISDTNILNWTDTQHTGKWKWKYDSEEFKLNIFYENELKATFKIISQEGKNIFLKTSTSATEIKVWLYKVILARIRE